MKKRNLLLAGLLLCGLLLLVGCKESGLAETEEPSDFTDFEETGDLSEAEKPSELTDAEETGDLSEAEKPSELTDAEEADDSADGGDENEGKAEENTVFFGLDDTVQHEGLCEMSRLYAEVLDDAAIAEGWYYYYTDSDESPASVLNWKLSEECYTTAEVLFSVKNISGKPQTFGDKITAQMLYQENQDLQTKAYDGFVFQQNPGQVEESGEIIMWSTKPVEIPDGESANVSFRFDIPVDVYEKVYATAEGEDTGIVELCTFSFGDGTTYVIDLTEVLIPASRYEG